MLADGSFEEMKAFDADVIIKELPDNIAKAPSDKAMLIDVYSGKVSIDEFIAQLTDDELVSLTFGKPEGEVPNRGISMTCAMGCYEKYGIPEVMTADGPAGLRAVAGTGVKTTAFPCATQIACTWNPDLAYEVGEMGAKEVKENNIGIWLTPAMNIHRNPLCGRNFEYFSEDPYLTGKMAAAIVRGIQSQKIAAAAKHFFANNKEKNRRESDSIISERAIREIYLKGFEICVKEADPWTIMSSYNIINSYRASENYDSLTGILRDEWKFDGMVMSDWTNNAELYKEVLAGNDVKMPESDGKNKLLAEKLKSGEIKRSAVEACVKRLLMMIMKLD